MIRPKVSVIIPVYNAEPYIEKCVRSLLGQTLNEIEYIFVDDCSPDNSISVMQSVLKEHPDRLDQIKLIRNEHNLGVGQTRQLGIKAAQGEYIIHCDSDDWVEPDMYETMYNEAKRIDADIVGCDIKEEYVNQNIILKQDFQLPPRVQSYIMLDVGSRRLERYLWNRLVKREFYENLDWINPNINFWEDVCVTVPAHYKAKTIGYVPKPLYHYNRTNTQSLVSSFSRDKLNQMIMAGDCLNKFFSQQTIDKKHRIALNDRLLACILPFLHDPKVFSPKEWRKHRHNNSIFTYPSLKMKLLMVLALLRQDKLLKFITSKFIHS